MINSQKDSRKRPLALAFAVLVIGLACMCNFLTPTPQAPTTFPQDFPTLPPLQPSPTFALLPSPTLALQASPTWVPLNTQGLNPSGPWMLISATDGLWAANPDGSNLVQLTQQAFPQDSLAGAVQPGGDHVVLLTSSGNSYQNLALSLLSLPDGRIQKITDLTSPQTEPAPDTMPGDPSFEAVRAILDITSYAWSPDGTRLAFIGVMDGPTADLYIYDTLTTAITRVSQDDSQNFSPAWSPDGKYLLFFGAASFGTGAGYSMSGVWSANGDGSNVTSLYTPANAGEELIGWRDDQTAVLDSWNAFCGEGALRLFNIVTLQKEVLQADCFSAAAAGKWDGAAVSGVLFSKDDGLYLLPATSSVPQKLSSTPAVSITWDPTGRMFVVKYAGGSLTTFTVDGSEQAAPAPANEVTMFGMIWAWTKYGSDTPGVWISGPGIDLGQIFSGSAFAPIWNTDDNTLFFFTGNDPGTDLYRATFSNYFNDAAPVGHLTGDMYEVTWLGSK